MKGNAIYISIKQHCSFTKSSLTCQTVIQRKFYDILIGNHNALKHVVMAL